MSENFSQQNGGIDIEKEEAADVTSICGDLLTFSERSLKKLLHFLSICAVVLCIGEI